MKKYFKISICISLILSCAIFALAEENFDTQDSGIVKIDSISKDAHWKFNRTGATPKSVFYIQIDDCDLVRISVEDFGEIKDLEINKKHLVKIKLKNKIIESFWFDFKKYNCNELRLWYKTLYGTWSLWPCRECLSKQE